MSDIETIRTVEQEQSRLLSDEQLKVRERVSRAEADASFRVTQVLKEKREIIDGIRAKADEDINKEMTFALEDERGRNKAIIEEEARRVPAAVSYLIDKVFTRS